MQNPIMRCAPWSEAEIAYLREQWAAGTSREQIAMGLKRTREGVQGKARDIGLRRRPRKRAVIDPKQSSHQAARAARKERACQLFLSGVSIPAIAERLGVVSETAYRDTRSVRTVRPPGDRGFRTPANMEFVRRHYRTRSARELAALMGTTKGTVIGIARDLGLSERRP